MSEENNIYFISKKKKNWQPTVMQKNDKMSNFNWHPFHEKISSTPYAIFTKCKQIGFHFMQLVDCFHKLNNNWFKYISQHYCSTVSSDSLPIVLETSSNQSANGPTVASSRSHLIHNSLGVIPSSTNLLNALLKFNNKS